MINHLQERYQLSVLLLLGAVAVLGVLPFGIVRYFEGNLAAALIDMTLSVGITALVAYACFSKQFRLASTLLAIFINTGVVLVVKANGLDSFLWVYPVFASTFILVKPAEALCLNILAAAAVLALSDILTFVSLEAYIVTILMLSLSIFVYASHSLKQSKLLESLNITDALTGAFNRRAMSKDIEAALYECERGGGDQLLVVIDLDYFKKVNDHYGHTVGDKVLKDFVNIITANIRQYDRLYRYGGEEFVLLVPNVGEQRYEFISNLRAVIKKQFKTPDGKALTVSLGAALWLPGTTADSWLKRADEALYLAKKQGRDQVVFSQ